MKKGSAVELSRRGFKVRYEKNFALYDTDISVDVFGSKEGLISLVECESSIRSYKILSRFTLLRTLEEKKSLNLSLPAKLQDALFPWVLRLRNVIDEVWLVDVGKESVVSVIDPKVYNRGSNMRGKVSVNYLGETYVLRPWKVLRFLINDKDLVLGVGDGDSDFKIFRLEKERNDGFSYNDSERIFASKQDVSDFMDSFQEIFLSKARVRIFSFLLMNGGSLPSEINEELGISLSTVYREIKNLEKYGLLETRNQLTEGRGRPSSLIKVNKECLDEIFEKIMDFFPFNVR